MTGVQTCALPIYEYTTGAITNRPLALRDVGPSYLCTTCATPTNESEEKMSLTSITISPNPSSGKFNLFVNNLEKETATLCIVDMTGRVISSPRLIMKGETIFIEEKLSPGIYLLKVLDGNKQFTKKIVIL